MAIFRLEAKIVSRGSGHSATAAAAYRTGTRIWDERERKAHDYSSRTKGVIESVILRPENSPEWTAKTATLWNEVERSEPRKDSQLCREFVISMPKELDAKNQMELVVGWAQRELVSRGMIAEISLHHPNKRNPHVHILATMRRLDGDKFSAKKPREWNDKALLMNWRESWANAVNEALEQGGHGERVTHLSLKAQGIDRKPEPKIGKEAMGMKKRGVEADPKRVQDVRQTKMENEVLPFTKAIQNEGEVQQNGVGGTWWERSITFMSRLRERTQEAIKTTWQTLVKSRSQDRGKNGPELDI